MNEGQGNQVLVCRTVTDMHFSSFPLEFLGVATNAGSTASTSTIVHGSYPLSWALQLIPAGNRYYYSIRRSLTI